MAPDLVAPDLVAPDLIAPDLVAPDLDAPDQVAPDLVATDLTAPDVTTPTKCWRWSAAFATSRWPPQQLLERWSAVSATSSTANATPTTNIHKEDEATLSTLMLHGSPITNDPAAANDVANTAGDARKNNPRRCGADGRRRRSCSKELKTKLEPESKPEPKPEQEPEPEPEPEPEQESHCRRRRPPQPWRLHRQRRSVPIAAVAVVNRSS
jgi:hypothetical protein